MSELAQKWPAFAEEASREKTPSAEKIRSKQEVEKETETRDILLSKISDLTEKADRLGAYLMLKRKALYLDNAMDQKTTKTLVRLEKSEVHLRRKIDFYRQKLEARGGTPSPRAHL